jgi:hypothetical protein
MIGLFLGGSSMARFLRRSAAAVMALSLLAGTLIFGSEPASAQCNQGTCAPGVWESSINIQNLSSNAATVSIDFYNSNGDLATTYSVPSPVPANGAVSIFVPAQVSALASGQYSAVVNSTEQVKATVNTASTNDDTAPWSAFGYEGADTTMSASTLYFPGLYKSYFGFDSEMVVQNVGTGNTTVTARFYNQNTGAAVGGAINLGEIEPNQSRTFSLAQVSGIAAGNIPYSAVVTSSGDVAITGIANIWRSGNPAGTASYNALTEGSDTLYAPALYKNYFGFTSALTVQNIGSTNASVTIDYPSGTDESFTLLPNQAREFFQPNNASLPSGNTNGVFSARVTATGGSVVGLVSLGQASGSGKGELASYNVPGEASNRVNIPNVLSDYYGYFTAVTVQNTCAQATNITISYPGSFSSANRTFNNVAAGGTVNILHLNNAGDTLPNGTTTSAVVSASNASCNLVAVMQHGTSNGVTGYNPAKQPSDYLLALTGSPAQ